MVDNSAPSTKDKIAFIIKENSKQHSRLSYTMKPSKKPSLGLKIYAFWTLIILVCILAWANMILTVVVFRVLHLGQGMESLEFIREKGLVKFYGETFLGSVIKPDGQILGFSQTPFQIRGNKGSVVFEVEDKKGNVQNSIIVEQNGTHVNGVSDFIVGEAFSSETPSFHLNKRARNIQTKVVSTSHVTSERDEKLVLRSDLHTRLSGSEGTHMEGREVVWTADQEVHLTSLNGSLILDGKEGISIQVKSLPLVRSPSMSTLSTQYKVCVCMPEGKLFRVTVPKDRSSHTACHNLDTSTLNPCI